MKVSVFFGTRPETIKLAPFIKAGRDLGHQVDVIFTGQHREMALPLLGFFGINPTVDLNCMRPNQDLSSMSSLILETLNQYPELKRTDALLVQGDTSSSFVGAYWAFLNKIPVIHLEAGLRTHNIMSPFPEEANRQLISRIASVHLTPTDNATKALNQEGVYKNVFNIGNTGLDALKIVSSSVTEDVLPFEIKDFIGTSRYVLITSHRRENFGEGMLNIASSIRELARIHKDMKFIFPVHLNPNVQSVMQKELQGLTNVLLTSPQDYLPFVFLMKNAAVILTDSGGVQEEAPTLKVPVVVMRETTERPEGVELGFSKLVGANKESIVQAVSHAIHTGCEGIGENPYGDGNSSQRAWKILSQMGVMI